MCRRSIWFWLSNIFTFVFTFIGLCFLAGVETFFTYTLLEVAEGAVTADSFQASKVFEFLIRLLLILLFFKYGTICIRSGSVYGVKGRIRQVVGGASYYKNLNKSCKEFCEKKFSSVLVMLVNSLSLF